MRVVYDSLLDRIGRVALHAENEDVTIKQVELNSREYEQLCNEIQNLGMMDWCSEARRYGYTTVTGIHVVKVVPQ